MIPQPDTSFGRWWTRVDGVASSLASPQELGLRAFTSTDQAGSGELLWTSGGSELTDRVWVTRRHRPTYQDMGVTAAARAHIYWVGKDPKTRERVQNWPVGPALLEVLGNLNPEVREALSDERARLREDGYPEDLPLPALWRAPYSPYTAA